MSNATDKLTSDLQELVQANNQFGIDLYSHLTDKFDGNLLFSPSSISLALAMTYAGARGDTAEEIANAMHFSLPKERLHKAMRALQETTRAGGVEFRIANRLWGQRGYHFLSDFLHVTEQDYGARLAEADFVNASEAARIEINDWVAEQTAQRIKDLIPPDVLDEMTRLVLVNAIYFLGDWETQFEETDTVDAEFYLSPNQTCTTNMMQITGNFEYGEFDDLQILELPYKSDEIESGSDFAMSIILPRAVDGIEKIESDLSAVVIKLSSLRRNQVAVRLPTFTMESAYSLTEPFQELGMNKPFRAEAADFSGVSENSDGLSIADVVHKAYVKVNESGTEAAAATAVTLSLRGGFSEPETAKEFNADHPFIFMIRDRSTEQIHFVGRVCTPSNEV